MSNETQVGIAQIEIDGFTINEDFERLLSFSVESEHFKELEQLILNDEECREPLVIWKEKKILVDGHHRFAICKKHGIRYSIVEKSFESCDAVMMWIFANQVSRRNMNKFQRAVVALKLEPIAASEAKERQSAGGGSVREKSHEPGRTDEKLAKMAGMSSFTLRQVKFILEYADQNTINKLNNGDAGYSINGVCEAIKEHLGKGEMTKIGIAKKQPYQQVNNIPEQTSPTSLSSPVSVARQKAKEKASKKIGIELPQDLVERQCSYQYQNGCCRHHLWH